MNPIKAVIADDEPAAVAVIQTLLQQFADDVAIEGVARDGLDAVRLITKLKPQIVFLDVDMPVINGVQVMEKLAGIDMQVIFTTGSADYALKALKLKAADYLLKPIDPSEFIVAIDRAREQIIFRQERRPEQRKQLPARLQFFTQNEIIFLDETDISHIDGMGSYCQIFTINGEKITVSKNIGQIAQKLSPELFFRSHNSHIINLDFVSKFVHRDGYLVEMKNGSFIEVSRRSKDGLLEALSARSR